MVPPAFWDFPLSREVPKAGFFFFMAKRGITEQAYQDAANALGVDIATIKAVADVESAGGGFLPSGKPKILFEGHLFHKFTRGAYSATHPTISYPRWTKANYIGGEGEWKRFNRAFKLEGTAAMKATSWGKFQIIGNNYAQCGFSDVGSFVDAMKESEDAHLAAFVNFVQSNHLADKLQRKDWAGFARGYNGPGYKKNKYDEKLAAAYRKHLKAPRVATEDSPTAIPPDLPTESPELVTKPADAGNGVSGSSPVADSPTAKEVKDGKPTIGDRLKTSTTFVQSLGIQVGAVGTVVWTFVSANKEVMLYILGGAAATSILVYLIYTLKEIAIAKHSQGAK